jgi:hypothetical protein
VACSVPASIYGHTVNNISSVDDLSEGPCRTAHHYHLALSLHAQLC